MNLTTSNDHNVYILGAGFSATAGLPVMVSFLNRMRDALEAFQKEGRTWECEAIGQVLDYRLKAASAAYWSTLDLENIEQLFSLAYAARHPVSKQLPVAMAATLDFCRERSTDRKVRVQFFDNNTSQRLRPPHGALDSDWIKNAPKVFRLIESAKTEGMTTSHMAALIGMVNSKSHVTGRNTFITFNYDTLVEDALARLHVPWTYGFPHQETKGLTKGVVFEKPDSSDWGRSDHPSAISVLKLHGSVNWTSDIKREKFAPLRIFRSYSALRKEHKEPRLVPPTWNKGIEDHLSIPWEQAIKRLQTATRVIIIGFSMPETDLHFRYLLAAGLQENAWLRTIMFVNPDIKGVEGRARALLRGSYIDQGLIRFMPVSSMEFARSLCEPSRQITPEGKINVGRSTKDKLDFWTSTP